MKSINPAKCILLVQPPFYRLHHNAYTLLRQPTGLGYLAGILKQQTDWDVRVYNADFVQKYEDAKNSYITQVGFYNYLETLQDASKPIWNEITSVLQALGPAIIGISTNTQNFAAACRVARLAKQLDRAVTVIVGGPHPSFVGKDSLACPDIDIAVRGEGELVIADLVRTISCQGDLSTIPNLVYRSNGQIIETRHVALLEDLDHLPFPAATAQSVLIDYDKYPLGAFSYVLASRGCPYNCFFCGSRTLWGRQVRLRSPQNVLNEISYLRRMGVKHVHFDDDSFGIHSEWLRNLCALLINSDLSVTWSCEMHVNSIAGDLLDLMKRAGCNMIQLGIESGNDDILHKLRKGCTVQQALSACHMITSRRIRLETFFMIGFPWETAQTIKDTQRVMGESKSDAISYSIFTPYPGTEAYRYCEEQGLLQNFQGFHVYHHQSPMNCFCQSLSHSQFRSLASDIEKQVDRLNFRFRKTRQCALLIKRFMQQYCLRFFHGHDS